MKKLIFSASLFAAMLLTNISTFAQETTSGAELVQRYNESNASAVTYLAILVCLILVVVFIQVIDISLKISSIKTKKEEELIEAVADALPRKKTTWGHLFRKASSEVKDKLKEHEYDGIKEYDNNPPVWFNWLFYGTIVWGAAYMMYYHVLDFGDLQVAEYNKEMEQAEIKLAEIREKAIKLADEPPYFDDSKLALGKTIYLANCAACHGPDGEGTVGPNLTDEYWLHGGEYKDIYKVVFNGVPEKGMLAWKKSLKPDEIRAVSSYINTIRGTTPPNPKSPQGEKVIIASVSPGGSGSGSSAP